jgi:hypothetical protein
MEPLEEDRPKSLFSLIPLETYSQQRISELNSNIEFEEETPSPRCPNPCILKRRGKENKECCKVFSIKYIVSILMLIPKSYRILVLTCLSACMIVISVSVGIIALTNGATPHFIFSYTPYVFLTAVIMVFGIPSPFKNWNENSMFYLAQEEQFSSQDVQHFLLGTFSTGPIAISSIILMTKGGGGVVSLLFISHFLIFATSLLYLFVFFTPPGYKDIFEDEE